MRAFRWLPVVMSLVLTSCGFGSGPPGFVAVAGLRPFSGCDELLRYVKGHALERVTAWGLPGTYGDYALGAEAGWPGMPVPEAAVSRDAQFSSASEAGVDYSGTNVQIAGVDEPDIVKTDGSRMFVLAGERLHVVDLSGPEPELRGSLELGDLWARDLLLLGDRVLLLGASSGGGSVDSLLPMPTPYGAEIAAVVEIDVSDLANPRVVRRLFLDGAYVSARMVGSTARVVVSSYPTGLHFVSPDRPGIQGEREALERNRAAIRESELEAWVPYFDLQDADGATTAEGPLLGCGSAHHPPEFSGFGMLTVLTVDLERGLNGAPTQAAVGVMSEGETVYASAESLYVATQRWTDPQLLERGEADTDGMRTRIHRFDIADEGAAAYRSSGEVQGWLLNQFAMDEHEGHLRVASTDAPPGFGESSESGVTVLAERGNRLVEVGSVRGLGKGERIFSVRFIGDRGYVVTFREVDPLYVVDLSDPASPSVEGELKIPGYSAYLHPVSDELVLGVGQHATKQGVTRGTQLSLFDVSDPTDPRRVDSIRVNDASSEAEWDHHAFLYWEATGLIVLPVNVYGHGGVEEGSVEATEGRPFFGALAFRLADGSLERAGRLEHEEARDGYEQAAIRRSLVVGERLYTVSDAGAEAADLETLEETAWLPFR